MKEEIDNTSLYQKLQSARYKFGDYKKENLGEGMILVEELKGGYWKPRYLIDNEAETACEFMDSDYCLLTVTADDISWETRQSRQTLSMLLPLSMSGAEA